MVNVLIPVLFIMLVVAPAADAQGLEDFRNFSRETGREISVVERSGLTYVGVVESVSAETVTLRAGSTATMFRRAEIVRALRMKDKRVDGAVLGALAGFHPAPVDSRRV